MKVVVTKLERLDTLPSVPIDLSEWRKFQDGLSELLGVTIMLCNRSGEPLIPPSGDTTVCKTVRNTLRGRTRCREFYGAMASRVAEKGQIYIYKCHANMYVFGVPVALDSEDALVIIGGRTYLSGRESGDFREAARSLGLDEEKTAALEQGLRTIPPRFLFTIPNIVKNLAVPFLRNQYMLTHAGAVPGERAEASSRLKELALLEEVYRELATVLERDELYETILAKSTELVGAEQGSLMILDNKGDSLTVKAAKGPYVDLIEEVSVRIGEGISGTIAKKGTPMVVRDVEEEFPARKNRPRYRTKSFVSIPLKLGDRVIGVINITDKVTGGAFSEEDLRLLTTFANYASIALERGAYYSLSEELKTLSMTDPLTGLFNRRYFLERLFEETERVKRHNEICTLFIIDIDDFKVFNDRYGHLAGDEALRSVAHALREGVRSMDVVSRYGGEEFSVILPHTSKKDAYVIAERIRRAVERSKPRDQRFEFWPTISIGVAEYPRDAKDIDELINNADRAMYLAKQQGKNRVVIYGG